MQRRHTGMDRMFGKDPKQRWKKENAEHVKNYNANYYKRNESAIKAQRAAKAQAQKRRLF